MRNRLRQGDLARANHRRTDQQRPDDLENDDRAQDDRLQLCERAMPGDGDGRQRDGGSGLGNEHCAEPPSDGRVGESPLGREIDTQVLAQAAQDDVAQPDPPDLAKRRQMESGPVNNEKENAQQAGDAVHLGVHLPAVIGGVGHHGSHGQEGQQIRKVKHLARAQKRCNQGDQQHQATALGDQGIAEAHQQPTE